MAQSYDRYKETEQFKNNTIGQNTFVFLWKKIKVFYIFLLITVAITIAFTLIKTNYDFSSAAMEMLNSISSLFLAQMSGLRMTTSVVWYLSAMIIAMLILYPIYLKWNDTAKKVLMPLIGIFTLGMLYISAGSITMTNENVGIFKGGMLRALGEIALGCVCYDLAMFIRKLPLTTIGKISVLIIEIICILAIMLYINGRYYVDAVSILFLIAIFTTIVYSNSTYNLKNNRIISFLGRLSLPLFISQLVFIQIFVFTFGKEFSSEHGWYIFFFCIIVSIPLLLIGEYIQENTDKIKSVFIK